MTDDRYAEDRRRTAELLARVDETLARPRPPEELRWNPAPQEPAKAQPARAPAPHQPAPATRAWVNRIFDNFTEAMGKVVGRERYRSDLRLREIERRLAELEKEATDDPH